MRKRLSMKRIKYICFIDAQDADFKRKTIPSATTKIEYIITALNRAGYGVDIISAAEAQGAAWGYSRTSTIQLPGNNTLTRFGCISIPLRMTTRRISASQVVNRLNKYLYDNIKPGDIVIAYHSPRYTKILTELRNERKFCLIGEIEEIYQDVHSSGPIVDKQEYAFFNACDKFIFPTQLLNDKLNNTGKKSVVIHGLYNVEPDRHVKFGDNNIHIIYAGTFDPRKGGATAATAAAEYLPGNFHMHILGFGSPSDTDHIKNMIAETHRKTKACITFDGLLRGEDFIQFIQKCQIGLSTQNPNAAFNATSFPSKILTYLSNGLKVVTIRIPAIAQSSVGNHLFYYNNQTPKAIASAIVEASTSKAYDGRTLLRDLDCAFVKDIKIMLEE